MTGQDSTQRRPAVPVPDESRLPAAPDRTRPLTLVISCAVLGPLIGALAGLLGHFLNATERVFLGYVEGSSLPGPFRVLGWRRLVSVLVAGLLVALIWWLLRTRSQRVPTVSAAVAGEPMPVWQTIVHVLAQIFFVGAGASIGREVAPRELGSMLSQVWVRLLGRLGRPTRTRRGSSQVDDGLLGRTGRATGSERPSRWAISQEDTALLVASAAGAGFAGVYLSPLTGMFFAVEILLRRISLRTVCVSLSMSALAAFVGGSIKGWETYYAVGSQAFRPVFLLVVVLAAPLFGLVGAGFRRLTSWAEAHQSVDRPILWQLPLAALLTGLVALAAPQVMGNGRALAQWAMNERVLSWAAVGLLLLLALLKTLLTVLTIRSGASGGTLTPAIALGAALGAVLGLVLTALFPAAGFQVWQCAILGAVGVLAASQRAPLMALAMLVEVSGLAVASLLPLGLAAALATASAQAWTGRSQSAGAAAGQSAGQTTSNSSQTSSMSGEKTPA